MSYAIFYDKVCIKVDEDQYIPMVLAGDNNVTVISSVTNREKRARHWKALCPPETCDSKRKLVFTEQEILSAAKGEGNNELFKEGNKFITDSDYQNWMKRLISKAKTMDEIKELNPWFRLDLDFYGSEGERIYSESATTSDGLLYMLAEYNNYFSPTEKNYTKLEVHSDKSLRKASKQKVEGQVVARGKHKKPSYVKDYITGKSISFTGNPQEAIVFENEDDMWEKLGYRWKDIKAVSYESCKKNMTEKNYVIRVDGGGYFLKLSSKSLFFTHYVGDAKRFTEKEALKKVEEIKSKGYKALLKVICISAKEEE